MRFFFTFSCLSYFYGYYFSLYLSEDFKHLPGRHLINPVQLIKKTFLSQQHCNVTHVTIIVCRGQCMGLLLGRPSMYGSASGLLICFTCFFVIFKCIVNYDIFTMLLANISFPFTMQFILHNNEYNFVFQNTQ